MIRMLIAEPTAHFFTLLCEVLAQEGFMVVAAANNYEGLSSASTALLGAGMSDLTKKAHAPPCRCRSLLEDA